MYYQIYKYIISSITYSVLNITIIISYYISYKI
jgi:hypothetical protein